MNALYIESALEKIYMSTVHSQKIPSRKNCPEETRRVHT
jgi:hypothetical protein